ncbi:MAG: TlpA family protein disulfide reductase [Polyangiaceae bacterium]|nr:TlpA family protein disulfide reductase [Polyangiaceae bacterium]
MIARRRLLLAAPLALLACGPRPAPPSSPSPLLGKPGPMFRRPTLDGSVIDLATLRGRTVVLKVFARYCEPCKRTLPFLEKFHKENPAIVLIGISEDETESQARRMVEEFGLTFPVVLDQDNVLIGRLRISEMPATFVLDRRGVVRWYGDASQPEERLGAAIQAIDREHSP